MASPRVAQYKSRAPPPMHLFQYFNHQQEKCSLWPKWMIIGYFSGSPWHPCLLKGNHSARQYSVLIDVGSLFSGRYFCLIVVQTLRCGEVEFGFASSVFNFFVVFENILLQGHVQTPLKKVVFDSNATFLSKHHGFLVGFGLSSVIWSTHLGGEWWYEATPPDLYQIYKICSEWKSSLAWVNLSSGSSPAAMTTAMSAERRSGSPGNKIKKLFFFLDKTGFLIFSN